MGEGTQEQTQGEGINLSSKRLAGHVGRGVWCADKLDKLKAGRGGGRWELQPPPPDSRY